MRCARGHAFDIARQGYVTLLTGSATRIAGDSADMVDARQRFLATGRFEPIARAVIAAAADSGGRHARLVDLGAGTGYYLTNLLAAFPDACGVGIDVAKPAARRLARAHPRAIAVVADAWRGLPIRSGSLTHAVSVFAPRAAAELRRVLTPDGRYVVVTPTARHLGELIEPLGMVRVDPDKQRRLDEALRDGFVLDRRETVEFPMSLRRADIATLVGMGPSARHQAAERVAALPESAEITASVQVATYRLT